MTPLFGQVNLQYLKVTQARFCPTAWQNLDFCHMVHKYCLTKQKHRFLQRKENIVNTLIPFGHLVDF